MGRLKRYRSALRRYHNSKGYGIHSPFAFNFVLNVLRERLPYYAYVPIHDLREMVISRTRHHLRHPRIISVKNAKLIFRVVNYFNPPYILQIGTSYGVSSVCMLAVSSSTRLTLCEPRIKEFPVTEDVLKPFMHRIDLYEDVHLATEAYINTLNGNLPFILVNNIDEIEYDAALRFITLMLNERGVIVMRNLSRSNMMLQLWKECKSLAQYGMTFSNDKIAVVVANPKLPRQDFYLWF